MRRILSEYGKIIISATVAVFVFGLLFSATYVSTNIGMAQGETHTEQGVMNAIGYEASKTDAGSTEARVDMINNNVSAPSNTLAITCQGSIEVNKPTEITALFEAKDGSDNLPVTVIHIFDTNGNDVLNSPVAKIEDGKLTITKAEKYMFVVKATANATQTKNFKISVLQQ